MQGKAKHWFYQRQWLADKSALEETIQRLNDQVNQLKADMEESAQTKCQEAEALQDQISFLETEKSQVFRQLSLIASGR